MISHDLARQLKEAGFPQVFPLAHGSFYTADGQIIDAKVNEKSNWAYTQFTSGYSIPTLDELIDALPFRFFRITRYVDNLVAECGQYPDYMNATGSTPAEAVARLWLAER